MSAVLDHQLDTASLDCWRSDPAAFCRALFGRPRHRQTLRVAAAEKLFLKYMFAADAGRLLYPTVINAASGSRGRRCSAPS
jgi:hypothetical protein